MPDTLAELPGLVTVKPLHPGLKPFNSQTARLAALKRHANDKLRAQEEAMRQATPTQDTQNCAPMDEFASARLVRVRAQLVRLDELMALEADPKRFKELAEASARLSDQEGWLANRPKPGSRRPAPERGERRQARATGPAYLPTTPSVPPTA